MFPRWSTRSCFALQALGYPMDLDVRLACRLLHNILLYIYQAQSSQPSLGLSNRQQIAYTYINNKYIYISHSQANPRWVYQTVNKLPVLTSTIYIYIYIRHSQANPHWVYQTVNKFPVLISTTNH